MSQVKVLRSCSPAGNILAADPEPVLNNAGQPFVSAILTLQEEQSCAAFQDINNSAKGWVSSGRLGWPAETRDALSGPRLVNRVSQQESSTWTTGSKRAWMCWPAVRAAALSIHSLGKSPFPQESWQTHGWDVRRVSAERGGAPLHHRYRSDRLGL